jgi:hypothetical protein
VPNDNIDRAVKRGSGADAGGADYQTSPTRATARTASRSSSSASPTTATGPPPRSARDDPQRRHDGRPRVGGVPVHPQGRRDRAEERPQRGRRPARVLEAGAEEVNDLGDSFEIVSEATDLIPVRTALQEAGIDYDSADPTFLPSMQIPLDAEGARKVFKLIEALEDSDEVQNVYANFDVSDKVLEEVDA